MELGQMIARLDELKAQIDALRPIKPEQEQRILQKFRLDWNYHSNAIEGNSLTQGETRAFLLEGLTAKGKPFKDYLDIRGHNQLILFLEDFVRQKEILTETGIREMHEMLLAEPYQVEARTPDGQTTRKWVRLGEYKTEPNAVQTATGEWIYYARPEDTGPRMAELVAWYRQQAESQAEHPLLIATLFHHRFTHIHPFDDGNGRMARALMNVILMREGFPPAVIKTGQRAEYVSALRKADGGDSGDLLRLVGDSLLHSCELVLRGAKGEDIQEMDDLDKEIELFKRRLTEQEEALPVSVGSQSAIINNSLVPLLKQLLPKLQRFDELFLRSKSQVTCVLQADSTRYHTVPLKEVSDVSRLADEMLKRSLLHKLEVFVSWDGFKRGGPAARGYNVTLTFEFFEMSYRVTEGAEFDKVFLYQQQLGEDEIRALVTGMTSRVLRTMESWVTPPQKA